MQIINYSDVELCHEELIVLQNVDFTVGEGEFENNKVYEAIKSYGR